MIILNFALKPEPKLRARMGKFGAYTPQKTKKAEEDIKKLAIKQLPRGFTPLECAFEVHMVFTIQRKKSTKNRICVTTRPDLDNYIKLVCDALNEVLWKDDGQIWCIKATKVYGDSPAIQVAAFFKDDSIKQAS